MALLVVPRQHLDRPDQSLRVHTQATQREHGDAVAAKLQLTNLLRIPSVDRELVLRPHVLVTDFVSDFRKGVWGGKNGDLFEHFPEITQPVEAASDHAAVFVDLNI